MQCLLCDSVNRDVAKFCGGCGQPLQHKCASCGSENPGVNRYCNECGRPFETRTEQPAELQPEPVGAVEQPIAQHRQISLICCDLQGSSILARQLGPEDWRYALNGFHDIAKSAIDEFGGWYSQYMGDGFLAHFGYPIAYEDNALRAVLTGFKIIEEMERFNIELDQKYSTCLNLRVGINSGPVIVDEYVIGEAPNVANRIQSLADTNRIVITEDTRRLLPEGVFDYEDLGVHSMKNIEPVRVFQIAKKIAQSEPVADAGSNRPLIGRMRQQELLLEHWERVKSGEGQAVIVASQPGVGKSKLVRGLEAQIGDDVHMRLRFQGASFHQNTALYPVIQHLRLAAGISLEDEVSVKQQKLSQLAARFPEMPQLGAVLNRLLGLPARTATANLPAENLRQHTLDVLIEFALQNASRGPTVFVCEDMHWFDRTTLELIGRLIPLIANQRAFLLMTTRSSVTPELQERHYLNQIALMQLRADEAEDLIMSITGGKSLPKCIRDQIVDKANGIPLYIEELTKMVLEAGDLQETDKEYRLSGHRLNLSVPQTLRDSLTARVDRVRGREALQLAAAIGSEFTFEMLAACSTSNEEDLAKQLNSLVSAELIIQKGASLQQAKFSIKHALIRDAAYSLLTRADREALHIRIANVLETRFPATVKQQPEIVAIHFSAAGDPVRALKYWYAAGCQAAARSAHNEAIGHFRHGLDELPLAERQEDLAKCELLLQTALGHSLRATQGWSAEVVKQAYTRALELSNVPGLEDYTFPALFGLWTGHFVRAEFAEAMEYSSRLLRSKCAKYDGVSGVLAHEAEGFTHFARGRFKQANDVLKKSIGMCDDRELPRYYELSAQDPRSHVRLYQAKSLWFLGYPDQALKRCREALIYANEFKHPFSQTIAEAINLRLYQFRGEAGAIRERAGSAIAVSELHGFKHYLEMSKILRGWALANEGEFEDGIADIMEGLEAQRSSGASLFESYTIALYADACMMSGRHKDALAALNDVLPKLSAENSEQFYAAEIYRLCGEANQLVGGDLDKADELFQTGLKIARQQHSRSLELKLLTSLYDLHQSSRAGAEVRKQLEHAYAAFDEGFDTIPLVAARSRLEGCA